MAQIIKRTPVAGTKDIKQSGRKSNPKHTELYAKTMHFTLTGGSREKIQAVAAAMHRAYAEHEYVVGGKAKKQIHIVSHSSEPVKVFDGCLSVDNV